MRVPFTKSVAASLSADPRSIFLTADLGYNAFEDIAKTFGPRFMNVGVAEQNMIGVAAGVAMTGYKVWAYSIAPFGTYRCLEQIRNDVCLHDLPVRIVGNGGGYTYGIMGSTHHALEDLGVLKPLPNMQLFFPCSNNHVEAAVKIMHGLTSPAYLRLSISGFQNDEAALSEHPTTLTRRYTRPEKAGLTVIGAGHAAQIVSAMQKAHPDVGDRIDFFGLARYPLDLAADTDLVDSIAATRRVLFVEEHYAHGAIGESFAAAFAGKLDAFELMAASYTKGQKYGSSAYHLKQVGLTPENVAATARKMLA